MNLAYADPPYPGCAHRYKDHKDYAGEVDHVALVARLLSKFDGFILHTSSPELDYICSLFPDRLKNLGIRIGAWHKPFAAFKRNVKVAYAWEPVLFKPCRNQEITGREIMRDWKQCSITLKRGLCGVKPEPVCHWAFEIMGAHPDDELHDLYPGTFAVTRAWESWKLRALPAAPAPEGK